MERARDIKQQQLRIEAMQKCYQQFDMEDVETKSKTVCCANYDIINIATLALQQKKCARTFMKLAQESEDRHNAEAGATPTKKKGLHK